LYLGSSRFACQPRFCVACVGGHTLFRGRGHYQYHNHQPGNSVGLAARGRCCAILKFRGKNTVIAAHECWRLGQAKGQKLGVRLSAQQRNDVCAAAMSACRWWHKPKLACLRASVLTFHGERPQLGEGGALPTCAPPCWRQGTLAGAVGWPTSRAAASGRPARPAPGVLEPPIIWKFQR
jgi:hypothetical protein